MCLEILKWCFQDTKKRDWKFMLYFILTLRWLSSFLSIITLCFHEIIWFSFFLESIKMHSLASWISADALVKAFAVKQVLPLTSKCKLAGVTRLLRVVDIKRRNSYATWVEVDEQVHYDRIFTVYQRVRNLVIELAKICQVHYLLVQALDFYWFTDCLRVVRILTIDRSWNTRNLRVKSQMKSIGRRFLFFTLEKIRSFVEF